MEAWRKPVDHFEPKARDANGSDVSWWHSPAGIQAQGAELGVHVQPEESWDDFKARVIAASGAGPWLEEQPAAIRDRVEFFRATGGAPA